MQKYQPTSGSTVHVGCPGSKLPDVCKFSTSENILPHGENKFEQNVAILFDIVLKLMQYEDQFNPFPHNDTV